jgi:hypothetical protein
MSMFAQYNPYMSGMMQQFQPGQQPVGQEYMNDPLIQKLMADQVKSQIINAFAPQQGQGGFLEQFLGTVPQQPAPTPVVDPVEEIKKKKKAAEAAIGGAIGNLVKTGPNMYSPGSGGGGSMPDLVRNDKGRVSMNDAMARLGLFKTSPNWYG